MKYAAISLILLMSCATRPAPVSYATQQTCHPEIPLLDAPENHGRADIVPPRAIYTVEPRIPKDVRRARQPIDEAVVLEAVVDEGGSVRDVCVLKGDPRLVNAAVGAIKAWKFQPATIDGRRAAVRSDVIMTFHLQ